MTVTDDMVERAAKGVSKHLTHLLCMDTPPTSESLARAALTAALSEQVVGWQPSEIRPDVDKTLAWLRRGPASTRDHIEFARMREAAIAVIDRLSAALSEQVVVPKETFDRAIKLLKQNTGLLCESGNLNNYRNLSDEELGKAWIETAQRTAAFLNEIDGLPAPPPVSPAGEVGK